MLEDFGYVIFIYVSVGLALVWALFNAYAVTSINMKSGDSTTESLISQDKIDTVIKIGTKIQEGADSFLK